jgi:hypothetical protein
MDKPFVPCSSSEWRLFVTPVWNCGRKPWLTYGLSLGHPPTADRFDLTAGEREARPRPRPRSAKMRPPPKTKVTRHDRVRPRASTPRSPRPDPSAPPTSFAGRRSSTCELIPHAALASLTFRKRAACQWRNRSRASAPRRFGPFDASRNRRSSLFQARFPASSPGHDPLRSVAERRSTKEAIACILAPTRRQIRTSP